MSYLCYSLDEAAQQLGLSETVLFRLSQFLKVPASAYEDVGYISFTGDLTFSDADIAFFHQVKERLLAGETLEEVKQRIRDDGAFMAQSSSQTIRMASAQQGMSSTQPALAAPRQPRPSAPPVTPIGTLGTQVDSGATFAAESSVRADVLFNEPSPAAIPTIQSEQPLRQAANKSFARYKHARKTSANRVFQSIAKDVGRASDDVQPEMQGQGEFSSESASYSWEKQRMPWQTPVRNFGQAPARQPLHQRQDALSRQLLPALDTASNVSGFEGWHSETLPEQPVQPDVMFVDTPPMAAPAVKPVATPWQAMIEEAGRQPRSLNVRLKSAAQVLRQQALSKPARKY